MKASEISATPLTDDDLSRIHRVFSRDMIDVDEAETVALLIYRAVRELRARRSSDLTAEDREALGFVRDYIENIGSDHRLWERALAALDKLLGAGK